MSLEHRAPKMIQPEPRVRAQERGPPCWFGTAFYRGGGFGSGDPADPESGAPAGTHERPRAFPAWPHAYKAGRPLPNHTFPPGWARTSVPAGQRGPGNSPSASPTQASPPCPVCGRGPKEKAAHAPEQALASRSRHACACTCVCVHVLAALPCPGGKGRACGRRSRPPPSLPRPFCGPSILKRPCVRFLFLAPSGS